MLLIDNDIVRQVLTMKACIDAQETAFLGLAERDSVARGRIDVYVPCERPDGYFRWGTMEGASKSLGVFAIRMKSDIVYWPHDAQGHWTEEKYCMEPGTYCGLVFLFSTRNGAPLAMINEGVLQHMRVGGGAGIGAKYLSRKDAHVVAMIGSGGMATTYLKAFSCVRDIRKVRVYSPTKSHRERFAEEMSQQLGIDVQPVDSAALAVAGADIVSTCTDSMVPALKGAWLEPGQHVTNLGYFETDDDVFQRANIIVKQGATAVFPANEREATIDIGRGHSPVAYITGNDEEMKRLPVSNRRFKTTHKYPSFMDLARGKIPGRQRREDITFYINGGLQGLQFAAAGAVVYDEAKKRGLGREIPTQWFLQDVRD